MIDATTFKPKTVYVSYIAATPERVWQALTDPAFSKQYFFGLSVEIEPKRGGSFRLLWPDGRVHIKGEVVDWSPPRRLCVSWDIQGMNEFSELPTCLVSYEIEPSGEAVKLRMTESHSWDIPPAILLGGEEGWPKILGGLKTLLETGKALVPDLKSGPPPGMVEAVKKAAAEKPWLKR